MERRADGESVLDAAGRLWLAGVELDWANSTPGAEPTARPAADAIHLSANDIGWRPLLRRPARQVPTRSPLAKMSGSGCLRRLGRASLHVSAGLRQYRVRGCSWLNQGRWRRRSAIACERPAPIRFWLKMATIFKLSGRHTFERDMGKRRRFRQLSERVRGAHGSIHGAIYLGSRSVDDRAAGTASYHALVALAEGLEVSRSGATIRIIVATFGAESVLNEPVRNPAAALALGPVLVLPTEVPQLQMRAVDLDLQDDARSIEAAAMALVEEVGQCGSREFGCVARRLSMDAAV